ncbi:hypothetical protein L5D93_06865 [Paenibacillus thiaminolyticus]|nr:hypothetical protein [Paenibacillus thiaminolyticus]
MLREMFKEFIELSRELRPAYPDCLGTAKEDWAETVFIIVEYEISASTHRMKECIVEANPTTNKKFTSRYKN